MLDIPRPPDPYSMGFDERTLEELTPAELEVARRVIYSKLGLDPDKIDDDKVRTYESPVPEDAKSPGIIKIDVFKTNNPDIFLQELNSPDGEKRWLIGPDQDI
ncbi:MAG: hypothetical protein Q7S88_02320 [Candidatus Daviesbacteria bacterium]|nr:hypothetical protein [Candidatus Daviesbacteria bacterium]